MALDPRLLAVLLEDSSDSSTDELDDELFVQLLQGRYCTNVNIEIL